MNRGKCSQSSSSQLSWMWNFLLGKLPAVATAWKQKYGGTFNSTFLGVAQSQTSPIVVQCWRHLKDQEILCQQYYCSSPIIIDLHYHTDITLLHCQANFNIVFIIAKHQKPALCWLCYWLITGQSVECERTRDRWVEFGMSWPICNKSWWQKPRRATSHQAQPH
jgi:hypothetical protein